MQIIRSLDSLRQAVASLREAGRIALVPTMGALHAGHMALVEEARGRADHVVASIFVNPAQFGPGEDLDAYPRRETADAAMLENSGVALLWAPEPGEMYPGGFATKVSVAGVSKGLCGAARPSHFDGVATVVAKLFNQVRPDVALFGEKDWQQLAVIRRMTADLDMGIQIVGVPIVRDTDGLALSSRNAYLSGEERAKAAMLPRLLHEAAAAIDRGEDEQGAIEAASARLEVAGLQVEYFEARGGRLLAAVRAGRTRLIDNVPVAQT